MFVTSYIVILSLSVAFTAFVAAVLLGHIVPRLSGGALLRDAGVIPLGAALGFMVVASAPGALILLALLITFLARIRQFNSEAKLRARLALPTAFCALLLAGVPAPHWTISIPLPALALLGGMVWVMLLMRTATMPLTIDLASRAVVAILLPLLPAPLLHSGVDFVALDIALFLCALAGTCAVLPASFPVGTSRLGASLLIGYLIARVAVAGGLLWAGLSILMWVLLFVLQARVRAKVDHDPAV